MKEKTIDNYLVRKVKEAGGWAVKMVSVNENGVPDRLVLLPGGRMFFVEVKRTGEQARPRQLAAHRQLQKLGFSVYVIDSQAQVREVLSRYGVPAAQLPADSD